MAEKEYPELKDEDIPAFVRHCHARYMDCTVDERKAETISQGFYIGGKHQWGEVEIQKRESSNRPWMSINRCKPAVDQVENEARNNPPGPQAHPVGGSGSDEDTADIMEGLIREYGFRCDGDGARLLALRNAAAGGRGVYEMGTDYAGERTMEQQIVLTPAPDPSLYFYDPDARMPNLEDGMWGGKVRRLTREQLIEEVPKLKLKVLDRNSLSSLASSAFGWMADVLGWKNDYGTAMTWMGGSEGQGPYYVCEFYMVRLRRVKLSLWTDNVLRFDGEPEPSGHTIEKNEAGEPITRQVTRRSIIKYVVTAFDVLEKTEWPGTIVPFYWVLGPEIWRDGKRFRLSLLTNAQDSQRGLNYAASSIAEITGGLMKTNIIGPVGTFDVTNAQGVNPWDHNNTQTFQYVEYKPVFSINPTTKEAIQQPPPTRFAWEAPIQRLLEFANFCGEQIKAATSVFFEPSLPSAADAQSGRAIQALQQQSNMGTANWQAALHRAMWLEFQQAAIILPQICSGERVKTIVRPDNQHEIVTINRTFNEFAPEKIDQKTGKAIGQDGKLIPHNRIGLGQYSMRVIAGPKFETRNDEAMEDMMELTKAAPQLMQNPAILSKVIRWRGEGNPEIEAIADSLVPDPSKMTPEMMAGQLAQAQKMGQAQGVMIQKLQQVIQGKLPQVEADKWTAALDSYTKIVVAKITASKDSDQAQADREASMLESILQMAHETAMQATDHDQAASQAALAAVQPQPNGAQQTQ